MTSNKDMPAMPSGIYQDGHNTGQIPLHEGLTKLEHFAGLAMQAMISSTYYADFAKVEGNMESAVAVNAANHAKALLSQLKESE